MDEIVISTLDEKVNISFSGRIDSEFASRNTEKVIEELKKTTELTLDFQNVEYISSAGLRLILKCAKIAKSCAVINVNTNVYEVFSISGFTEMIKIQRKKRELSIEGKELIGEGANGKVYHYDIDTIVKVYKDCSQMNYIENENYLEQKDASAWHEAIHLTRYCKWLKNGGPKSQTQFTWKSMENGVSILAFCSNDLFEETYTTYSTMCFSPNSVRFINGTKANDFNGIKEYMLRKDKYKNSSLSGFRLSDGITGKWLNKQ